MILAERYKKLRVYVIALLVVALMQCTVPQTIMADGNSTVTLQKDVTVSLQDAQILNTDTGKLAAFTISIDNQSNSSIPLIDYWARIKASGDKSFVTRLIESDKKKELVPSKSTINLTYYANVDKSTTLEQLHIDIIKWDFGVSNYERILGSLASSDNGVTAYNATKGFLLGNSKLETKLVNYTLYRDQKYGYLNVEVLVKNNSSSSTSLNDLKFQLIAGAQSIYSVDPSFTELTLKGNESKRVMLTVSVPVADLSKNLVFQYYAVSGENSISLPLASMAMPTIKDTAALTLDKTKVVYIDDRTLNIKAMTSTVSTSENRTYFTTKIELENKSSTQMPVPSLGYYVKTKDGYLYPLQLEEEAKAALLPNIKQTVTVTGQIPSEKVLSTSELVLFQEGEQQATKNFLGNFKIVVSNSSKDDSETNVSSKITYEGMVIEQVSLQRTPNELNDLLVAEFTIKNTSKEAKAKLNLNGQFLLDGVKLPVDKTTIVNLDQLLTVAPDQTYRVIAYTEIPYTQQVNKFSFRMTDEKDKETSKYIHTFAVNGMQSASLLAANQSYEIDKAGGRGEVKFLKANIYKGLQSDIFYAELEYTNNERRAVSPSLLAGYIENSSKDLINLSISKYEKKLLPGGKVVLAAWAAIPRNFEKEKLEFFFGEALQLSEEKGVAIVNPVYTQHIIKTTEAKDSFEKLPFMEFDLSIRYIAAYLDSSDGFAADTVDLSFEYDLEVREDAPYYSDKHSIIVEYEDISTPKVIFSKQFDIAPDEKSENALEVGKGKKVNMKYTHELIQMKNFDQFKINIYDVYQGNKTLIASKEMSFGTVNP